jgi:hypothetical protein
MDKIDRLTHRLPLVNQQSLSVIAITQGEDSFPMAIA